MRSASHAPARAQHEIEKVCNGGMPEVPATALAGPEGSLRAASGAAEPQRARAARAEKFRACGALNF